MAKMRAVQVPAPKGNFELVERPIPDPPAGAVRIRVEACGVCHSDMYTKEGLFPGLSFPRVPGHEVAGTIDALGTGVAGWAAGERVGVGWHGGHCAIAIPAAVATSSSASPRARSLESRSTAVTPTTCSRRPERSP